MTPNVDIAEGVLEIGGTRKWVSALALEAAEIASADRTKIGALIVPPGQSNIGKVLDEVRPLRDLEMASNVGRTKPPLIIEMGDAHVPGIAKNVGLDLCLQLPLGVSMDSKTEVNSHPWPIKG